MRKWYVPLTVLSLGGLGAFLLSERGKSAVRWLRENVQWGPEGLLEWNEAADAELQRIQDAVNRLADSLQPQSGLHS